MNTGPPLERWYTTMIEITIKVDRNTLAAIVAALYLLLR
jgi:hypothetical protein